MKKRLFLIAGYDAKNCIDDALIYMLGTLSHFGDIIFYADSNIPDAQLKKIRHHTIHAAATHHGEYDFGSYKRAYIYATDNNLIKNYEFVYFINDSVYGPLGDMTPIFNRLESSNWDAFGLVQNPHPTHPHIQSWFIGCRPCVFTAPWFDEFFRRVTRQKSKGDITRIYEQGFTRELISHNIAYGAPWICRGRTVYNQIKKLYKSHMPFVKKAAIPRRHGALGRQFLYIITHISPETATAILSGARHTYGNKYICWLLTKNPVRIIYRSIRHCVYKVFIEGI